MKHSYAQFQAKSGRTVTPREDGSLLFDHANGYLGREEVFDAEEYFQERRDEALGRWRDPLHPDHLVVATQTQNVVRVFDERTGLAIHANREDVNTFEPAGIARGLLKSAWSYFEAHPEPKPWHDAKHGEVWAVTERNGEALYRVTSWGRFEQVSGSDGQLSMPITHWSITAARRFWPEDAS